MTIITDFNAITADEAVAIYAAVETREDLNAAAAVCMNVNSPRVDRAHDEAAGRASADEDREHRAQLCEDVYACADAIGDQPRQGP
jgi:hypothetical protein